ncbi:MAG: MFS transporter [Actinomycetota bacterium]|nr:MFS transporter [Actinomycetota bacterium]
MRVRTRRPARFKVLRHAHLRRFYIGFAASKLGTAMASIALAFAVLDSGGSAVDLGYVFASEIVPQVALMLGGGVLADRFGRRQIMLGADVLRTGSQAVLAGLLFAGHPPILAFCALAAAVGVGDALFSPGLNGLTVELVPADELGDANAIFGMARSLASVAGPALAGVLVAAADPATVIALDAASYAASALALSGLRLPERSSSSGRSMLSDLTEGWAEFRSRTWLWVTTAQFTLFNLVAWGPFLLLGPVLSKSYLGGAAAWGSIMAAFGAGSVAGGLVALGRRPRRPLLIASVASLGYPAPIALLALHAPTAEIASAAVVAGLASAGFNTFWSAALQQQVPADTQARVYAFSIVGSYSAGPIAFAGAGPIAAIIGAPVLLGTGAAVAACTSAAVIAVPAIRAVLWHTSPAAPPQENDATATADSGPSPGTLHHSAEAPAPTSGSESAKPTAPPTSG